MSKTLENLVAFYVDKSGRYDGADRGKKFGDAKYLERQVIDEIVFECADEIDAETQRREDERAAARELDEFRSVLLQCVTLALLVGIVGSHLYGMIEATFYQPSGGTNIGFMFIGLVLFSIVTLTVLFKEYLKRLFESMRRLQEARGRLRDGH